jgi:uncharacterized protein (TIGR02246 family)
MRKLTGLAVLAGVVFAASAVFTASKSDDDVVRQARDRAQIEELMWRYARALDGGDAETYASLYTPDGQFSAGGNPTKGREALKKMIEGVGQRQGAPAATAETKRPPMFHMTANEQLRFIDKDHARIDAYYITAFAAAGQGTAVRVAAVGRSIDELERVNGQWMIKSRNVAPQD